MTRAPLPEKWIDGLAADAPASDAAERVMHERLESVGAIVRKVVKSKAQRDEAVHQLRVATRRAEAALLAFKPWLRRDRRRRVRKALRRLRAAAGQVRMCDVHRELLGRALRDGDISHTPVIEAALLMLDHDRLAARRDLFAATRRTSTREALDTDGARLTRRESGEDHADMAPPLVIAPIGLHHAGVEALSRLAREVLDAAAADLTSRENLHQLRLRGKRLRYALEIFGPTSGEVPTLSELSAAMIDLQERLGMVNDRHEVAERLARYAARIEATIDEAAVAAGTDHSGRHSTLAPQMERLADQFESQCVRQAAEFVEWWNSFDATPMRERLAALATDSPRSIDEPEPAAPEVVVVSRYGAATRPLDEQELDMEHRTRVAS